MSVYLIHVNNHLHYVGYAEKIGERLEEHSKTICTPPSKPQSPWIKKGMGAKLLGVLNFRGIPWTLARVWVGADRKFERKLKNQKKSSRFCPACRGQSAYNCMVDDYKDLKQTEEWALQRP